MIILIDNYDSFSYNLYQLIGEAEPDIRVIRNNEATVKEIENMRPQALVFSPGPGRPENAGICEEAIRYFAGRLPMLGVCLGHQAICQAFGGKVSYAKHLMHGKQSELRVDEESRLFRGLGPAIKAARYHSLSAQSLPECLKATAWADDGEIMAVEHIRYPIFGLQFHPESVMTPDGNRIIQNFMEVMRK